MTGGPRVPLVSGGRPSLRPDQVQRVRSALRQLYRDRYGENATAMAAALGRSQSAVSQLLSGKNAPSYETAERVAALKGVHVAELLGDAPTSGLRPSSETLKDRPNLADAVEFVRARGRASERAIADVCAAAAFVPDLDVSVWIALLLDVERLTGSTAGQDVS